MKDHQRLKHGLQCGSVSEGDHYGQSHRNSNQPLVTVAATEQSQLEVEISFIEIDWIKR